jgi:multidrug resistance efflux pump
MPLMEILLILTYTAICFAIFKIFSIPVNKWTLPSAALGGIFLIGFILLVMNYNHPFTRNARIYFTTTPIIPDVKGRVIDVPVEANRPLKAGDVLFRIDPKPYEFEVQQRRAALVEAEQNVLQLKAAYESALSAANAATAQRDTTKKAFDRYNEGNENAQAAGRALPFSIADVENRRGAYLAADGAMHAAISRSDQARITYQSQIDGVHTSVARLRAELSDAEYNLALTTVRAPGAGFVTQLALRPGMYVNPMPFKPAMVFVNADDQVLAAGFQQNALLRVRPGDEAEVAFTSPRADLQGTRSVRT